MVQFEDLDAGRIPQRGEKGKNKEKIIIIIIISLAGFNNRPNA